MAAQIGPLELRKNVLELDAVSVNPAIRAGTGTFKGE